MTVDDLIELARKRIDEHRAEATSVGAISSSCWMVTVAERSSSASPTPSVTPGDGPAQCTINAEARTSSDHRRPRRRRQFFFEGRLQRDGSMALAMKLRKLSAAAIRARA